MHATHSKHNRNNGSASEITGWALVILGAILAIVAGRQVAGLFVTQDAWAETTARVVRARVAPNAGFTVYQEVVYFVKGNRFQQTLEAGRFDTLAAAHEFIAKNRRPGSETVLWVNVRNPSNVTTTPVEETASVWSIALFALLGLVSVQGGTSLISASMKRERASQTDRVPAEPLASM